MSMDWKLLFQQLFALEIKKEFVLSLPLEEQEETYNRMLNAFLQYSPRSFNDLIDVAMAAANSQEAYQERIAFYEHPVSRALLYQFDASRSVGAETRGLAGVNAFLSVIKDNQDRPIEADENFFASAEGRNISEAMSVGGDGASQSVALVMVPGYAAHTIPFAIFEEIVSDANAFYGRPKERPLHHADGIDLSFEDHETFYSRGTSGAGLFDILHPAGVELGNTTGHNCDTTDHIARWIETLPAPYQDTKFIFLGYSKGAPIVLDLVKRHPHLSTRVLGYVTHAGVMQGAHAARLFLEQAEGVLRDVPVREFVDRLRGEDPHRLAQLLSPLFSQVDLSWLSVPRIRAVFDLLGYDTSGYERQAERLIGGREVRELLDGARDLTPLERVRSSLIALDNATFTDRTYVFNVSAVADVRDFVRPPLLADGGRVGPSLLAPTFDDNGALDWAHLSLDAIVLYATSIAGFKSSPGGLFDTQVDLANTKTLFLDRRPLSASLSAEEIDALWADEEVRGVMAKNSVDTKEAFASTPRRNLIRAEHRSNLDAIDLGEFRGHHWSLFTQALRPPTEISEVHAVWDFPRKAYMRALLQVLALRTLVDASRKGGPS